MPKTVVKQSLTKNQVLAKFILFSVCLLVVPILVTFYFLRGIEHAIGRPLPIEARERPAVQGGLGILTAMAITLAYVVSALREPSAQVEVKPLVQDFVKQLNAGKAAAGAGAKTEETKKQE